MQYTAATSDCKRGLHAPLADCLGWPAYHCTTERRPWRGHRQYSPPSKLKLLFEYLWVVKKSVCSNLPIAFLRALNNIIHTPSYRQSCFSLAGKTPTLSNDSTLLRLRMMSNFLLQEVEGPNQRIDGQLLLAGLAAMGTFEWPKYIYHTLLILNKLALRIILKWLWHTMARPPWQWNFFIKNLPKERSSEAVQSGRIEWRRIQRANNWRDAHSPSCWNHTKIAT